jgi:hypothetical protein
MEDYRDPRYLRLRKWYLRRWSVKTTASINHKNKQKIALGENFSIRFSASHSFTHPSVPLLLKSIRASANFTKIVINDELEIRVMLSLRSHPWTRLTTLAHRLAIVYIESNLKNVYVLATVYIESDFKTGMYKTNHLHNWPKGYWTAHEPSWWNTVMVLSIWDNSCVLS